jgi:hypothetical protein
MAPTLDAMLSDAAAAEVNRRVTELARPEMVQQRNVEAVLGMPARDYLRHVRSGHWPSWSDRRLRYSRTVDVVAYLTAHPITSRETRDGVAEAHLLARVGMRRVAP